MLGSEGPVDRLCGFGYARLMVDKRQLCVVLNDGKHYEILECAEGVNPDVLLGEKYPRSLVSGKVLCEV